MKTLVFANHRAGVGRSTVAVMLVQHLSRQGHRVLAVDMDYRGAFGRSLRQSELVAPATLTSESLTADNFPRLPSVAGQPIVLIDGAGRWLWMERERRWRTELIENLQDFLQIVNGEFDACVIDTSAQPDVCLLAALACADLVVMPTPLDQAWMGDVGYLFWHSTCGIHLVRRKFNQRLRWFGVLPTLVDAEGWTPEYWSKVVADHEHLLIRAGSRKSAGMNGKALGPLSEFAYVPYHPQIAQTLASGQMLWDVPATAARAAWNQVRPGIEAITALITSGEGGS